MERNLTCLLLALLLLGSACNEPVHQESPKEKSAAEHPKLIKTRGNPDYGNVQCSLQDRDGNLWFGTTENGLYKYDGKSFQQYLMADGLTSNGVYSLLQDKDGKIWIGTHLGLSLYDPSVALPAGDSGTASSKMFTGIPIPLPKNLLPSKNPNYHDEHQVYSMLQAKSGKLWFATSDGVYVHDGETFTLFEIKDAPNGFLSSNDKAERLFEDKAGNIWFGGRTNPGTYRFDGNSITQLQLDTLYQSGPTPKPHTWGWPQVQDRNGNIWFSNWGGAYRYDGELVTTFNKEDGLPGIVTRIIEDRKGNLWFSGDGLCRYDGKSFTCFSKKNGLLNPSVWSILEDRSGNLWVGTRGTGLFLFDGERFWEYSEYRGRG